MDPLNFAFQFSLDCIKTQLLMPMLPIFMRDFFLVTKGLVPPLNFVMQGSESGHLGVSWRGDGSSFEVGDQC